MAAAEGGRLRLGRRLPFELVAQPMGVGLHEGFGLAQRGRPRHGQPRAALADAQPQPLRPRIAHPQQVNVGADGQRYPQRLGFDPGTVAVP